MGEIKSTLDLVMEKTKHLTLSDEEKDEQKRLEASKKVYGLLQKYRDNRSTKEHLEKEIDILRKTCDLDLNKVLAQIILDGLKLGEKNESLLELLREICGIDISNLEQLFHDFLNRVGDAAEEKKKAIKTSLAKKHSISGPAVVPNLDADNDWMLTFDEIKDKFDKILSREKDALKLLL